MSETPRTPVTLADATWSLAADTEHSTIEPDTVQAYLVAVRRLATDARTTATPSVQRATDALTAQLPARLTGTPTSALERVLETALTAENAERHAAVTVVAELTARLVQDHPRVDIQQLSGPLTTLARASAPHRAASPGRGVLALNTVLIAAASRERQRGNTDTAQRLTDAAAQTRATLQNTPDWSALSTTDHELLDTLDQQVTLHQGDLRSLDTRLQRPGPWLDDLLTSATAAAVVLDAQAELPGTHAAAAALREAHQRNPATVDQGSDRMRRDGDGPRPPDPRMTGHHR